jgi:hypothetical protein
VTFFVNRNCWILDDGYWAMGDAPRVSDVITETFCQWRVRAHGVDVNGGSGNIPEGPEIRLPSTEAVELSHGQGEHQIDDPKPARWSQLDSSRTLTTYRLR